MINEHEPQDAETAAYDPSELNTGLGFPRPDTNVDDIVRDWLKIHGFDGLVHGESECGCHLDDFLICGGDGGAFPECQPAFKFSKKNSEWWMSTNKNWRESDGDDS